MRLNMVIAFEIEGAHNRPHIQGLDTAAMVSCLPQTLQLRVAFLMKMLLVN